MRVAIVLAAIPLAVGISYALTPSKVLVVTPVTTESIRAQRLDDATFQLRWSPITSLPPAVVVHYAREERDEPVPVVFERHPAAKPVVLRLTVCARHGMRRVSYTRRGYTHWRCRR